MGAQDAEKVREWNCGCKIRYSLKAFVYEHQCDRHEAESIGDYEYADRLNDGEIA
jgi:hypothetical protein